MPSAPLRSLAEKTVLDAIAELPDELRRHAEQLPVLLEDWPGQDLMEEGWDPDLLGLFTGDPWEVGAAETSVTPRTIRLFLGSLWEFAGRDEQVFAEEVRTTFLHEFGHFLGLDEDDLDERDLS